LDLLVEIPVVAPAALDHLPEAHVGTGPYHLVDTGDASVTMAAFDHYWGGRPPIDRLRWQAQPEEARRVQALLAGQADLVSQIAPDSRKTLIAGDTVHLVRAPSSICVIFICNAQSGPCADPRVRQALNYALDVGALIRQIKGGGAQALHGPLTPLHLGYDPAVPPYPYDPDKARALLAEAGYAAGLKLELDIPTTHPDEAPRLAKEMVRQYAPVGVTTLIHTHGDRPAYADHVKAKEIHDACCFDSSPLSTYRSLREKFHSGIAGPWWQGYHNQEVNTLLEQAWATVDDTQRQGLYRRACQIIRDDAPWVFLYSPAFFWGVGSRAKAWKVGVDGLVRLA
jgi:peptide/nickel transport system substrate-binding protein